MENNKLYALFDSGGQGMIDNGLLGVFTTREQAEIAKGNNWYSISEFDANKIVNFREVYRESIGLNKK